MGDKLAVKIREAEISQEELARKVGISGTYMSFIVRGLKTPNVDVVRRIAEVLGCKIDDIV